MGKVVLKDRKTMNIVMYKYFFEINILFFYILLLNIKFYL